MRAIMEKTENPFKKTMSEEEVAMGQAMYGHLRRAPMINTDVVKDVNNIRPQQKGGTLTWSKVRGGDVTTMHDHEKYCNKSWGERNSRGGSMS